MKNNNFENKEQETMKRLKLSNLKLIKEESEILGNSTSVVGEYYIPSINKTAFYKMNGCMIGGKNEEDLRELLASKVLKLIDFPHAEILLVTDEEEQKGCLSINILNENEEFVEPQNGEDMPYKPVNSIEDFIEKDLEQISTIKGITSEELKVRKEYLLKYLFVSAVISNTDIKMDNMFIIRNSETGKFRNSEYYDMGVSFIESNERNFFYRFSSEQIIEQLYDRYPTEVAPFGKQIEKRLTENKINELLGEEDFEGLSKESKKQIKNQLLHRTKFIKTQNLKEENNFKYGINDLHDVTRNTEISVRDRVLNVLVKLRDRVVGRDRNE